MKSWSYVHKIPWVHHSSVSRREADSHGPNEIRVWMFGSKVVNLPPCWSIPSRVAGNLHGCETWRGLSEMGASYRAVGPVPHPKRNRSYSGLCSVAQLSSINHIMALYVPGSSLIPSAYTLVQVTIFFFFLGEGWLKDFYFLLKYSWFIMF